MLALAPKARDRGGEAANIGQGHQRRAAGQQRQPDRAPRHPPQADQGGPQRRQQLPDRELPALARDQDEADHRGQDGQITSSLLLDGSLNAWPRPRPPS
jgi:hypothetical protein